MTETCALIAVQLAVDGEVVASGESYRAHIEAQVGEAIDAAGSEADLRIVVVPEAAGHLALLATGSAQAKRAKTLAGALASAAMRRPLDVLRGVASTRTLLPRHAVLAALAPDGERFWRALFGPLARRHRAWIVAGSHLRQTPSGDLVNASFTFAPDGRCVATTVKVNMVPGIEDGSPRALHLTRGDVEHVPVVDTPAGKLATAIGYDGFSTPHTTFERFVPLGQFFAVDPQRAHPPGLTRLAIVANPSANLWPWHEAWPPKTLEHAASRYPTRAAQWRAEGLAHTLAPTRGVEPLARWGVTAHLVGNVLDLRFEGVSEIFENGRSIASAAAADRGGHVVALVRAKGKAEETS